MDQITTSTRIRFRSPASYPQIREAARINAFCQDYTQLYKRPTNDPELISAMRKLANSESFDPDGLLLLSSIVIDRILISKPPWVKRHAGQLLTVSTDLHSRQAERAEEKGKFNIAVREYWTAGRNADVMRVYQRWANRDKSRGNIREAQALQEMLNRGTHPLNTPVFSIYTTPAIAKKLLSSTKRKE
jgi:hypothetical protein